MPQLTLQEAQDILGRVVENPDGPATQALTARQIAEACAVVIVRNALLGPPTDSRDSSHG